MALSEKAELASKYFGWAVLVLSAVFAADLSASTLERNLSQDPEALSIASATAVHKRSNPADLDGLLRENASASEAGDQDVSDNTSGPAGAVGLEGVALRGTIANGPTRAAILEKDGESSMVLEGSPMGDYVLESVLSTWVYFAPKSGHGKGVRLVMETVVDPEPSEEEIAAQENEAKTDSGEQKAEGEQRLSLDDIRAALNDTGKIASQVRVVPETKDDQPYGTKLIFRQPDNIMSQMGLQDEDILLSINGQPARSMEDMYAGYMTLRNATSLEFVIDRGGQQQTVRYELAKK